MQQVWVLAAVEHVLSGCLAAFVRCSEANTAVYSAAAADVPNLQQWLQHNCTPLPVHPQIQTANLGQRMVAALTHAATAAYFSSAQKDNYTACCDSSHQCHPQVAHSGSGTLGDQQPSPSTAGSRQQQLQQSHQTQTSVVEKLHGHAMKHAGKMKVDVASGHQGLCISKGTGHQRHLDHRHLCNTAVIVVGTDIPDLSAGILSAAIHSITHQGYEMVLGPAKDGGFYLLGFSAAALVEA